MKIWKFQLGLYHQQAIEMPKGAKLLTIQVQRDEPVLWALCDEDQRDEIRHLRVYGTGHPITGDPGTYIGTFQVADETFVGHVFEPHAQGDAQ